VLLVTGDDAACAEGRELVGDGLTTVAVKKGLGATSARQIPPALAPDGLRFRPGVERIDDRTISVTAPTWWEAWKAFYF